jgi:DNA-binding NtrC family response regulator
MYTGEEMVKDTHCNIKSLKTNTSSIEINVNKENCKIKILVLDDEEGMREMLKFHLESEGYEVKGVSSASQAIKSYEKDFFHILITDYKMPGKLNGTDVLKNIKENVSDEVVVIIITAFGTINVAIEAMKDGAFDFITKPFDLDHITTVLKKAESYIKRGFYAAERDYYKEIATIIVKDSDFVKKIEIENQHLEKREIEGFGNIIGKSDVMENVYNTIKKVANTSASVLIKGDTGTGKELVAYEIHKRSCRGDRPLICVHCATFDRNLFASELFGYKKGAFTGAVTEKIGLFEVADKSTLFLDDIDTMPLDIQAQILRLIEYKTYRRVGDTVVRKSDVRIIAATNTDLIKEVEKGRFRKDLYYRLNAISLYLPPLKARKEDIRLLVSFFLKKLCSEYKKEMKVFSDIAMDYLQSYDWPGNIRELRNIMDRIVILCDKRIIEKSDLFLLFGDQEAINADKIIESNSREYLLPFTTRDFIEEVKRGNNNIIEDISDRLIDNLIEKAINFTKGDKIYAAKILGISKSTLYERIKKKK